MNIKTVVLTICGMLLLILGAIGAFLPILPTTPFVLAAAGCFSGTPRLQGYIMRIPFFREHITNYKQRRGIPRRTVIQSLVFLWGMLIFSMFRVESVFMPPMLFCIGIAVTIHLLIMSRPKERDKQNEN